MYSDAKKKKNSSALSKEILLYIMPLAVETVIFLAVSIFSLVMYIGTEYYYIMALLALATGGFASGFIFGRKKRQNGLINGLICALPASIIIIITSLALNSFTFDYRIIISILVHVVMSGIGGITSVNIRKKSKIKR